MPQHNLLTAEELSIIDSKLALPHRTQEDWAAIKAFLPDRDVISWNHRIGLHRVI